MENKDLEKKALFNVPLPKQQKQPETLDETINKSIWDEKKEKERQRASGELLFPKNRKKNRPRKDIYS